MSGTEPGWYEACYVDELAISSYPMEGVAWSRSSGVWSKTLAAGVDGKKDLTIQFTQGDKAWLEALVKDMSRIELNPVDA